MKAVVKYGYGPRETELRDVPIPEIGDDDLLVEVKAAGVCGSDIAFDDGHHKEILFPPVVLGHEFSGVVAKVGKNVTEWKVGDRVVSDNTGEVCGHCYACNTADYLSCPERKGIGYGMDGGFTNYVKILGKTLARVPNSLMRIPDCMSFEEAAILDPACNGYMAVVQEAKVMPGDFVAVFGVGALGLVIGAGIVKVALRIADDLVPPLFADALGCSFHALLHRGHGLIVCRSVPRGRTCRGNREVGYRIREVACEGFPGNVEVQLDRPRAERRRAHVGRREERRRVHEPRHGELGAGERVLEVVFHLLDLHAIAD